MEFQHQQYTIDALIQRIRTGRLALPDFQRDFVWNPSRVVELIDSVSRQWPIGSLLLLSGPQPFAIRPVDSGPTVSDENLDIYILDGQQRVTSLFHAVSDVSDFCYYIDFEELSHGADEYISWERRKIFESRYPTREARANAKIALIRDVWDLESFYSWIECLPSEPLKSDFVRLRDRRLPGLHAKVYKIFAIVLEQAIELEALARIFETLNRTGVALNAFDLMVAALYPTGFRLRDEWEKAQEQFSNLQWLEVDELEPLKLIALMVRGKLGKKASRGVRQGDLLRLERSEIGKNWVQAIEIYSDALAYCKNNFGVSSSQLVPSWAMILGVASWLHYGADAKTIHAWWMDRLLAQYFSQAANTRIVSEFDAFSKHNAEDQLWPVPQNPPAFDSPAKANGVLMRGIGALLVRSGAVDLLTREPLSNVKKVVFRVITRDGAIRRLGSSDALDSIILVSEDTDKKLGSKLWLLNNLDYEAQEAVASQGIDLKKLRRSQEFTFSLFKIDDRGEL